MSFLKHALNLAAQKDSPPPFYARRFDDWLRLPLSGCPQLETNDYFLGLKLEKAFITLTQSPAFQAMYTAYPDTFSIPVFLQEFEDEKLKSYDGFYSPAEGYIGVNFNHTKKNYIKLNLSNLVSILSHEYRHAYQDHTKMFNKVINTLSEDPILVSFFQEADAVAFQILVCFELLNETGNKAYLNNVERRYEKQTKAFLEAIENGETKGQAQTKAFEAWFLDTHTVNYYYQKELDYLFDFFGKEALTDRIFSMKIQEELKKWQRSQKQNVLEPPLKEPKQLSFNFLCSVKNSDHDTSNDEKPALMPEMDNCGKVKNDHDYLSESFLFQVSRDYFLHKVQGENSRKIFNMEKTVIDQTEATLEKFEAFSKSSHNILKI